MKRINERLCVKVNTMDQLRFLMENVEHEDILEVPTYFHTFKHLKASFHDDPSSCGILMITFDEFKAKYFPGPRIFYANIYPDGRYYVYDNERTADACVNLGNFERVIFREILE